MAKENENSDDELLEKVRKERQDKELGMYVIFSDDNKNLSMCHHNSNVVFGMKIESLIEQRELIYYANLGLAMAKENPKERWSPDKSRKMIGTNGMC